MIKRKVVETIIPLQQINEASIKEKSIRHGHPSTIHTWWARRPLAACRTILLAQILDAPEDEIEMKRIQNLLAKMADWKNVNDENIQKEVKEVLAKQGYDNISVYDPFAGGGCIPLEAARMGLNILASDLNPVSVLINKALVEYPGIFFKSTSINEGELSDHPLVTDIKYYSKILTKKVNKKIGRYFPKINTNGKELQVIAWVWARTVPSPDPTFKHINVPLISSYILSAKRKIYLKPIIDGDEYRFDVKSGKIPVNAKNGTKVSRGANFKCILSKSPLSSEYIKEQAKSGRMGQKLIAIIAKNGREKIYCNASEDHEKIALSVEKPQWSPENNLPNHSQYIGTLSYGIDRFCDLFTKRQMLVLSTFIDSLCETEKQMMDDLNDSKLNLTASVKKDYVRALKLYLAFAIDKLADRNSMCCTWDSSRDSSRNTFGRQAIPMTWDFLEIDPFSSSTGNYQGGIKWIISILNRSFLTNNVEIFQRDAMSMLKTDKKLVISMDPPYYDNIPYADLSDYFYILLRQSLKTNFPDLFKTVQVPKKTELVADRNRWGGKENAEKFFLQGMKQAIERVVEKSDENFPMTIYYAFKQSEVSQEGISSTGWETFLEALIQSNLVITGTWPLRTELANRMRGQKSNALASSILIVCRKKKSKGAVASRREFISILKKEIEKSVSEFLASNLAAVDMAQSIIGPGISIYSKYSKVLEIDGKSMNVRNALRCINELYEQALSENDSFWDEYTAWLLTWFQKYGFEEGMFGEANALALAKNISIDVMSKKDLLISKSGKVNIVSHDKYSDSWDENSSCIWEQLHYLIKTLQESGEVEASKLLKKIGKDQENCKLLAYKCFDICDKNGWAKNASAYNGLIMSWVSLVQQM